MFAYLDIFKMEWINYRPDLHNLQTVVTNEVSVNVKTKNTFKYDYFPVSEKCTIYRSLKH